jgi:hypothetical protein
MNATFPIPPADENAINAEVDALAEELGSHLYGDEDKEVSH